MCAILERDLAEGRGGTIGLVPAMVALGERKRALELLQESVRRREPFVVWMANDERYAPLRELPGFWDMVPPELRVEPELETE